MANSVLEKETSVPDPVAETYDEPPLDEQVDAEKEVSGKISDDDGLSESHETLPKEQQRTELDRTQSLATQISVTTTGAVSRSPTNESRPWYKNLNPLRWGKIPPVPKEKTVSPEYKAGFFSALIFAWVAPLMQVPKLSCALTSLFWVSCLVDLPLRQGTSALSSSTTSGASTQTAALT
jgi:hypothetical protein